MKLWTSEIEKQALQYPFGSQDGLGKDAHVWLKVFNSFGRGTWLITEAEKQEDGDWMLFGYMHIFEHEWGYVMLSELQNVKIRFGALEFGLERDLYIGENATVNSLLR